MLYIPWMVILCGHNIQKISFGDADFGAAQGEKLHKQVVHRPIYPCKPLLVENSHFASLARVLTGPKQDWRLQKTSFHILVGIYCHNIPTHTPQSG